MKVIGIGVLALMAVGACVRPEPRIADAELQVELIAIRAVLGRYSPAHLVLDREYAHAGHAPPSATGSLRPLERQQSLEESLRRDIVDARGDSLRVRASAPTVGGETANIDVTVDGRLAGGRRGSFYETVSLVLEREGDHWAVRRRTQLGIS